MSKLYYLAHPYSAGTARVRIQNVENCITIVNKLLDMGYYVYAPIVMTHPLHLEKDRSWEEWIAFDTIFMDKCDGLILSGNWRDSRGCKLERDYFLEQKKEILEFATIGSDFPIRLIATDNRRGGSL